MIGSNLAPAPVFDAVEDLGWLTPNEAVTQSFISFLGDNKDNGKVIENTTSFNDSRLVFFFWLHRSDQRGLGR